MVDSRPRARVYALASVAALAALGACEIPSIPDAPPAIDLRWVVPAPATRIAVATLLPSGVSIILPDSSGFTLTVPTTSVTRTLGQDCGTCAAANGLTVPKPAFVGSASLSTTLPSEISSATLSGGTLQVVVNNNYGFDPLRPSTAAGSARGYAVITISNNGVLLGKDSVDGANTALPSGGSITRSIPLAGTVTGTTPVTIAVTLSSPVGDPVTINSAGTLVVNATPQNIRVATANVSVANKSINSSSTIDLEDIDDTIKDRVQAGALLLTVSNPFTVSGQLTVSLRPGSGTPIVKTVQLTAGNSTPTITFTKAELQALLGTIVTVTYTGTVNSTAGTVNVSPKQAVVVNSRLDITLQVGG